LRVGCNRELPTGSSGESLSVILKCDAKQRGSAFIPVSWNVLPLASATPDRLSLGVVAAGQTVVRRMVLRFPGASRVSTVQIAAAHPDLALTYDIAETDEATRVASLTFNVPEAVGVRTDELRIETDDPNIPLLRVPVSMMIREDHE
jgi:hypothetical protein